MTASVLPTGPNRLLQLFLIVPVTVGLLLVAIGARLGLQTARFMVAATPARGEIVSVERVADTESYSLRPTVRYTAADGVTRTLISPIAYAGWGQTPRAGDPVRIRYLASNPEEARLNNSATWELPFFIVTVGMLFATPFGAALLASRSPKDMILMS